MKKNVRYAFGIVHAPTTIRTYIRGQTMSKLQITSRWDTV